METIKAYLFWIICALILLLQFVIMSMISPEAPGHPGLTAEEAKRRAEQQYNQQIKNDLLQRARMTREMQGPPNPIERSVERIEEVLNRFIVTNTWGDKLGQAIDHHRAQLVEIKTDLVRRCAWLHAPFPDGREGRVDEVEWYGQYRNASAAILRRAIEGGIVDVQAESLSDEAVSEDDQIRSLIGLYTDPTGLLSGRRDQAVVHMRLTRTVIEALLEAEGVVHANPLLETEHGDWSLPEAQTVRPRIVSWQWEEPGRGGDQMEAKYGRPYRFTVTLEGPPSALLAGAAMIDSISRPPFVRLGSEWQRQGQRQRQRRRSETVPERHVAHALDEAMQLRLRYVALDFAESFRGDPTIPAEEFATTDVMSSVVPEDGP